MSSIPSSSRAPSSGGETDNAHSSSPRVHRIGKQSHSRATRSEYAAFKALLRPPSSASRSRRAPTSRATSRRASTLAPSSLAPSDSDSSTSDSDEAGIRWPNENQDDLVTEPLGDLIKTFATGYIRQQGLQQPAVADGEEETTVEDLPAQLEHGPDPEVLSTLSQNVISKLNQTLASLASGHRLHRSSGRALSGHDVLVAYSLTSIPESNAWEAFSDIDKDEIALHTRRLNIVRGTLKARPIPPRAAFYAPLTPRQDRDTAKYFERAKKRNKRFRSNKDVS